MENSKEYIIGIDLGGTRVKFAVFEANQAIVDQQAHHIRDEGGVWAHQIKALLAALIEARGGPPACIGLAAPGLATPDSRAIAYMPGRLHGLEGLDWAAFFDLGVPVAVLNDAHAAMFAEHWRGAARGFLYAFLLTLGTGVGGAVLADDKILTGTVGRFGHLGHTTLNAKGPKDIASMPGSLEDAIGECTIVQRTAGRFHSTKEMVDAVRSGDAAAEKVWRESIENLACGIASLINVLDPEAVILGGGITNAGSLLFEPLQEALVKVEWRPGGHSVKILRAQLGEYAGAIGAIRFAVLQQQSMQEGR